MPVKSAPSAIGGARGATTTGGGGGSGTDENTHVVRRDVGDSTSGPDYVSNTITLPATGFFGTATSGSVVWEYTGAARPSLTAEGIATNSRYLAEFRITKASGQVDLNIERRQDTATNQRSDLTTNFENNGRITVTSGSHTLVLRLEESSDTSDPYIWVPNNASEAMTFANAVDNGDGSSAATMLMEIPDNDTETLSDVWDDWGKATVILSSEGTGAANAFDLVLDEPSGIEHGDYFDLVLDHVTLSVTAASGITYTDNDVDDDEGAVIRFVWTDRGSTPVPVWTAYQLAHPDNTHLITRFRDLSDVDVGETVGQRANKGLMYDGDGEDVQTYDVVRDLNDIRDVSTGANATRAQMGLRFNSDGTSLVTESWPASGQGGLSGYQEIGDAERVENRTLSGQTFTLHESTTLTRGIPFHNDATHLDFVIEFNANTYVTGENMLVEYSLDRGTTWHRFLDEDGDDVDIAGHTATEWEQRITREFCSEKDPNWNTVNEDYLFYVRLVAGTASHDLEGTVNFEWTPEDDSATSRYYSQEVYDTGVLIPSVQATSAGTGYTVTQVGVTPVAWEKIVEIQIFFSKNSDVERMVARIPLQLIEDASADFSTVPTTHTDLAPMKAVVVGKNLTGHTDDGPVARPYANWLWNTRYEQGGSTLKERLIIATHKEGAYLTKLLITAVSTGFTIRNVRILREK